MSEHDAAVEWLADHPGVLGEFRNEWVAMDGPRVVAHAPSILDCSRLAHDAGIDDPLFVPVFAGDRTHR
jgi:hypothetical protein